MLQPGYATNAISGENKYGAQTVDERSSVQRALDSLSSSLATLQGNIDALNSQLAAVSRAEQPTPLGASGVGGGAGTRIPACEIESQIASLTELVHQNSGRVLSIRERLCV